MYFERTVGGGLNMSPRNSSYYLGDCSLIDAKLFFKIDLSSAFGKEHSYFKDFLFSKTRFIVLFAASPAARGPALVSHVLKIIGLGSKKEMIGVYARGIVARVANTKTWANFVTMHFKACAVGPSSLSVKPKITIPMLVGRAYPLPTTVKWDHRNFCKKPIFCRAAHAQNIATLREILHVFY